MRAEIEDLDPIFFSSGSTGPSAVERPHLAIHGKCHRLVNQKSWPTRSSTSTHLLLKPFEMGSPSSPWSRPLWPTGCPTRPTSKRPRSSSPWCSRAAIPATVAVANGQIHVGCDADARSATEEGVENLTPRYALGTGQARAWSDYGERYLDRIGAGRMAVFATGGIGGVHRGVASTWDVSADLAELAASDAAVVSAGAVHPRSPQNPEVLESSGIPVIGHGTDEFGFLHSQKRIGRSPPVRHPRRGGRCDARQVDAGTPRRNPRGQSHPRGGSGGSNGHRSGHRSRTRSASEQGVEGKALTPFLLRFINEATGVPALRRTANSSRTTSAWAPKSRWLTLHCVNTHPLGRSLRKFAP